MNNRYNTLESAFLFFCLAGFLMLGIWPIAFGYEQPVGIRSSQDGYWGEVGGGSAYSEGISGNYGSSTLPSLAISSDGSPIIAWADSAQGNPEIYVRRWDGISWVEMGSGSASGGGISANGGNSRNPSLAISSGGTPIVAWQDDSSGDEEIYVRRWNGTAWAEMGGGSAVGGGISSNDEYSVTPSLAISPNGTPIIAWEDSWGGESEIYVRRWDGTSWVEMGSGSATEGGVSANSDKSFAPSLAIGPDGVPLIAWQDWTGGDDEIYLRRWNGTAWVEMGTGSATGGGISDNNSSSGPPSLAISPDGTPIIAWQDEVDGDYEIYVRRWNGSTWVEMGSGSASGGGISAVSGRSFDPSLAIGPDGTPFIAWDVWSDSDVQIYLRRWNNASWVEMGGASASAGGISANSGYSLFPSLAISPDGTPFVAWADDSANSSEIYVRRWQPDHGHWTEMGAGSDTGGGVSNTVEGSWYPSLAIGADGNPIIAWQDAQAGTYSIYIRRWDGTTWVEIGSGSASGRGISIGGGNSESPSLAIGPDGSPIVAWDYRTIGKSEIYVRRWNGTAWVEMGSGSTSGGGISMNSGWSNDASLAVAPDGTAYITWQDDSSGDEEIYLRRWNGTSWVEMGSGSASGGGISNNVEWSASPSLAVSPDGTPIVAWYDLSSGLKQVYVRRWNGTAWAEMGSNSASGGGISNSIHDAGQPTLAIGPDGNPIIAWFDTSSGNYEIYVRRWNGAAWVEMGRNSASGGGVSFRSKLAFEPSLAIDPDGVPIIAWEQGQYWEEVLFVRRWNGTAWVEMGDRSASGDGIAAKSGFSRWPSLAIDPDGNPIIAWQDEVEQYKFPGDRSEIFVRRWQPSGQTIPATPTPAGTAVPPDYLFFFPVNLAN